MKKKSIPIILIIFILIMIFGIGMWINNIKKDSQKTQENMLIIQNTYTKLEKNIEKYNETRTTLLNGLSSTYSEKFQNDYTNLKELLLIIEENMQENKTYIQTLEPLCQNRIYSQKEINTICNTYPEYYEKLVNVYWNDIEQFNSIVTNYNGTNEEKLEKYSSKEVTGYMDYNQDGTYLERIDNETSEEEK